MTNDLERTRCLPAQPCNRGFSSLICHGSAHEELEISFTTSFELPYARPDERAWRETVQLHMPSARFEQTEFRNESHEFTPRWCNTVRGGFATHPFEYAVQRYLLGVHEIH